MPRKQKTGIVVSDKMQKSIVVEVTRMKKHPLYKKYVRVRKKFMAHDAEDVAHIGDFVRIEESRPISQRTSGVLKDVIRKAARGGGFGTQATKCSITTLRSGGCSRAHPQKGGGRKK